MTSKPEQPGRHWLHPGPSKERLVELNWPSLPTSQNWRRRAAYNNALYRTLNLHGAKGAQHSPVKTPENLFPAVPVFGVTEFAANGPRGPFVWDAASFITTTFPLINANYFFQFPGYGFSTCDVSSLIIAAFPSSFNTVSFDAIRLTIEGFVGQMTPGMPYTVNVTFTNPGSSAPGLYNYQVTGRLDRPSPVVYFFAPAYSGGQVQLRPITYSMGMFLTPVEPQLGGSILLTGRINLVSLQMPFVREELQYAMPRLEFPSFTPTGSP